MLFIKICSGVTKKCVCVCVIGVKYGTVTQRSTNSQETFYEVILPPKIYKTMITGWIGSFIAVALLANERWILSVVRRAIETELCEDVDSLRLCCSASVPPSSFRFTFW